MSLEPNPYEPPSVVDEAPTFGIDGCTHQWNGRTFTISARAAAPLLWMDTVVSVTIDGSEVHQQKVFKLDDSFRFQFAHDAKMVDAHVRRRWGFFARRIKYEFLIDDEIVGRSQMPIENWGRGVAVMLSVNLVIFGCLWPFVFA